MTRSRLLDPGLAILVLTALGASACSEAPPLAPSETRPAYTSSIDPVDVSGPGSQAPISCPTLETRSASAVIGPDGGTVELDGHSVTLPSGAVRQPTTITITAPASRYLEVDLRANDLDHFEFDQPVTVALSYEHCARVDLPVEGLSAWHVDESSGSFLERMPTEVDQEKRVFNFVTPHFSFYVIAD